jgi:hypothetical protein
MPIALPKRVRAVVLAEGSILWRVHRREHGPLWFGPAAGSPPAGRFDAPGGEFGICYFGESVSVAVLETLVRGDRRHVLDRVQLEARAATSVSTNAPMRLLQFEGAGLVRLGIGAEQAHAASYADCQRMMVDVFLAHPAIDGVRYRSRWDNSLFCFALFDRAANKLNAPDPPRWLGESAVIGPTLDRYELDVV